MIKANEIRIGNKFHMINSAMVNTVFDISDNTRRGKLNFENENQKVGYSHLITVEENGNQYKPIEMEGIPLTEDWLLRFGFECSEQQSWSSGEQVDYKVYRKGDLTYNTHQQAWWLRGIMNRFPKYVHELQNLVFALTGEELKLNVGDTLK